MIVPRRPSSPLRPCVHFSLTTFSLLISFGVSPAPSASGLPGSFSYIVSPFAPWCASLSPLALRPPAPSLPPIPLNGRSCLPSLFSMDSGSLLPPFLSDLLHRSEFLPYQRPENPRTCKFPCSQDNAPGICLVPPNPGPLFLSDHHHGHPTRSLSVSYRS